MINLFAPKKQAKHARGNQVKHASKRKVSITELIDHEICKISEEEIYPEEVNKAEIEVSGRKARAFLKKQNRNKKFLRNVIIVFFCLLAVVIFLFFKTPKDSYRNLKSNLQSKTNSTDTTSSIPSSNPL